MKTVLIIIIGLYLFKLIQNKIKKKQQYDDASRALYDIVERTLGTEDLQTLKSKKIWVGMPECLIYYTFDTPDDFGKRSTPNDVYKTWYYNPIPNARSNAKRKYYTEVYSTNGFISHWDMLS